MILASSSAVVRWLPPSSAASKPLGVTKCVWLSPSSLAFWFISSANCSTLPARCSASITAVSLCDSSIREYKRSLSLNFCPSTVPSRTLGWATALALTDTLSSGSARSNARMQVMILVVLAIGRSVSAFFANKIRPLSASIKTADRAYNCPGVFSPYAIFVCSSSAYTHETGNRSPGSARPDMFVLFSFFSHALLFYSPDILCYILCPKIFNQNYRFNFNCTSSSASSLKCATCSGFGAGSSSRECTLNLRRNSSVVPNKSGFPGASIRPTSSTRSYSTSLLTA